MFSDLNNGLGWRSHTGEPPIEIPRAPRPNYSCHVTYGFPPLYAASKVIIKSVVIVRNLISTEKFGPRTRTKQIIERSAENVCDTLNHGASKASQLHGGQAWYGCRWADQLSQSTEGKQSEEKGWQTGQRKGSPLDRHRSSRATIKKAAGSSAERENVTSLISRVRTPWHPLEILSPTASGGDCCGPSSRDQNTRSLAHFPQQPGYTAVHCLEQGTIMLPSTWLR